MWLTESGHLFQDVVTIVIGHSPVKGGVGCITTFNQFVAFLLTPFAQKMSEVEHYPSFRTFEQETELIKIPRAVLERLTEALCYAA